MDDRHRMTYGLDSLDRATTDQGSSRWWARIMYHAVYALAFALRDIANAIREHTGGS